MDCTGSDANTTLLPGCFLFNASQKYNLDDAQAYCQGVENATLIEIFTEEQLDFFKMARFAIEGQDMRKNWWLGGTDRGRDGDFCNCIFYFDICSYSYICREGDWFWMNSLRPVGDFVWWQTQPSGGLDENCMHCTVDAGLGFWDGPCDDEYYPVCQRIVN